MHKDTHVQKEKAKKGVTKKGHNNLNLKFSGQITE